MADDLEKPLKAKTPDAPRFRFPVRPLTLIAGGLTLAFAGAMIWILLHDDPLGGEPRAIVKIENTAPPADQPQQPPQQKTKDQQPVKPPSANDRTVTIIDGKTGQKREVLVNDPPQQQQQPQDNPNAPQLQTVPDNSNLPGADPRLIEPGKHGSIPKTGTDGSRPLDVYASPLPVPAGSADSLIAIVITGLGVSDSATNDAILKLPPGVTLAFIPYSSELQRWIGRARSTGHEVLLQIPMEPFDYPDNDPGPQTLITSAPKDQNIDRLHFFLSRAQGYVGVMNFMGARFTASADALAPVIADTNKRGLLYLDDGSSPRSTVRTVPGNPKNLLLRADAVLDMKTDWSEIDAALARLETMANEKGVAIATAAALPVTLERIARWAKTLEARGIRLVPVSAAFLRRAKQS